MAYALNSTKFWWEADPDDVAAELFAHVEQLESDQQYIQQQHLAYAKLYSGREDMRGSMTGIVGNTSSQQITNNVISQVIDTATSVIAKNKPKIRILTSGADWADQRKAQKLEKFLWAEFNHREIYDIGPDVFRDACVYGTGALKIFAKHGKVCAERVPIDEIIVDEAHCANRKHPRELFHRRLVDRDELCGMFPDHEDLIERAGAKRRDWADYREVPAYKVVVIEGWKLPAAPGAPGRHVIAVETGVLLDKPWKKDTHQFALFRWNRFNGFYGKGIAEEISDIQLRLYQLDRFIQKCQDLIAVPRVFVDVQSKVLRMQLDNRIGAIIPYRGQPPTFYTPKALDSEIYNYRNDLAREAFERIGLNQGTAQAMVPTGVESAVAMREVSQRQDSRFSIQAQRYEEWYKEVGRKFIDCASELYHSGTTLKTNYAAKNLIETIDWKDVDMEEERFGMSVEAASIFSMSAAARLQSVTELAQVGVIGPQEMRRLLNHPDLEQSEAIANADQDDCDRVIGIMLEGEFDPPEPFQNLEFCLKRIQLAYLKARTDGAPEEILENFRTWISQARGIIDMGSQPAANAPMPEQGPIDPATAAQVAEQGIPVDPALQGLEAGVAPQMMLG